MRKRTSKEIEKNIYRYSEALSSTTNPRLDTPPPRAPITPQTGGNLSSSEKESVLFKNIPL